MAYRKQTIVTPGFRFVAVAAFASGIGGLFGPACAETDSVQTDGRTTGSSSGAGGSDTSSSSSASSSSSSGKTSSSSSSSGVGGAGGAGGAGGCDMPMTEVCNDIDDDCNGKVDDGDPDGGGACDAVGAVGECKNGTLHCMNGALVCTPGAPAGEACDGLDNNCDGVSDEGNPGGGAGCVTQLPGVCANGTLQCQGATGLGCVPNVQPGQQQEICNGLDDDCNGQADDGNPESGAACQAMGVNGECKNGTTACQNGQLKCTPGPQMPEICDGKDNNCDGNTDEGVPGVGGQCATGLFGICATGINVCSGAQGLTCMATVMPGTVPEACNGQDDDCDNSIDEGIAAVGQNCTAPGFLGICQFGTNVCPNMPPYQLTCNHPNPGTIPETCNGQDDDCNGVIDDPAQVNGMNCPSGLPGVCAAGKTSCVSGSQTCQPNVLPNTQPEICDSLDNNCNGMTDEMNPTPACSSQNPGAQFVQSWACTMGTCAIAMCQSGHTNINNASGDGCECSTDAYANTCIGASTLSVAVNGTTTMTGKIETAAGSDWVTFSFTGTPVGAFYHPKVELTNSGGGQYAMDVMSDCNNTPTSCNGANGGGVSGTNVNVWEQTFAYTAGAGCCSDQSARVTSVKVRVYRKNGDAPTCDSYTVTGTNF